MYTPDDVIQLTRHIMDLAAGPEPINDNEELIDPLDALDNCSAIVAGIISGLAVDAWAEDPEVVLGAIAEHLRGETSH